MENKVYKYLSRYKQERILEETNNPNEYILSGDHEYIRYDDPFLPTFIDFDGGPFIQINNNLLTIFGLDKIVKKIIPSEKGYIILTE